jgi:hypothetical protein
MTMTKCRDSERILIFWSQAERDTSEVSLLLFMAAANFTAPSPFSLFLSLCYSNVWEKGAINPGQVAAAACVFVGTLSIYRYWPRVWRDQPLGPRGGGTTAISFYE